MSYTSAVRRILSKATSVSAAAVITITGLGGALPVLLAGSASAATSYSNGFETSIAGWEDGSTVTRTAAGTIPASSGSWYADAENGAFTRFGGYESTFPGGGYTTKLDVYVDTAVSTGPADKRFDVSFASSNSAGNHLRDFIFNFGTDTANEGQWLVSVGNNTPGNPATSSRPVSTISESGWYTLSANFQDNSGVLEVTMTVQKVGGATVNSWPLSNPADLIGSVVGGHRYAWIVPQQPAAYAIDSIAIDNVALSNNDTVKPTITFANPTSFDAPFQTGPNLEINVSDSGSGVASSVLHVYYANGTPAKFCSGTTCDTSMLPSGNYYVKAGAVDGAGNNRTVTQAFTIDADKPMATITSPANGQAIKGTFTVTGTASDALSAITKVDYTVNQINALGGSYVSSVDAGTASGTTDWSFPVTGLANGYYRLKVQAFDAAGNFKYAQHDVLVDNTRPEITFLSPASFDTPFQIGPNIMIQANDGASSIANTVLHVYNADGTPAKFCPLSTVATTQCNTADLTTGDYYVKAGATDTAGNNQTVTKYFTVDAVKPSVNIVSPIDGALLNTDSFTISGAASDADTSIEKVTITVSKLDADGNVAEYVARNQSATYDATTGNFSYDVSGLDDGVYTLRARAFDAADNRRNSKIVTITIDTTAPIVTVNNLMTTDTTPTLTGTVDDALATVDVTVNGVEYAATVSGNTWSAEVSNDLAFGAYDVVATAADESGNTATDSTVDELIVMSLGGSAGTNTGGRGSDVSTPIATQTIATSGAATTSQTSNQNSSTGATGNNGQVLGTQTEDKSAETGTSDEKDGDNKTKGAATGSSNFLGLGWRWLPLILLTAGIIYGANRRANGTEK